MLGMKQNISTAYHPQTDGHVEQSHQETEAFLRHYIDHLQDDWYDWLAIGEFQYNDKVHSTMDTTHGKQRSRHLKAQTLQQKTLSTH
jgi:hypothetical protein